MSFPESESILKTAITLLDNVLMIAFPELPLSEENAASYANASLGLARRYFGQNDGLEKDEDKYILEEIASLLALHPPLMSAF